MRNPSRLNGTQAPQVPELSVSVNADPKSGLCRIVFRYDNTAYQVALALDDAEGVANLILAKVKEAREGASPIVVVPGMGGIKSS